MYNFSVSNVNACKEANKSRVKRDNDDEEALLLMLKSLNILTATQSQSLKNIYTKEVATTDIQSSLLHAGQLGQEVKEFVRERLIPEMDKDKPAVSFHASLHRNNVPTFANLYEVAKNNKDKDNKTIVKADRNVLKRLITAYEAGRPVDLISVLKHELLAVPLSVAEMNVAIRTGNKSVLADVITEGITCPETIEVDETSSCLNYYRRPGTVSCTGKACKCKDLWGICLLFM